MVSSKEVDGKKSKLGAVVGTQSLSRNCLIRKKIAKEEEEEVDQLVFDLNCESRT